MTKHALHSDGETLGKLLWALDGTLVWLIEQILNTSRQASDHAEWVAQNVKTQNEHIHLLQSLQDEGNNIKNTNELLLLLLHPFNGLFSRKTWVSQYQKG